MLVAVEGWYWAKRDAEDATVRGGRAVCEGAIASRIGSHFDYNYLG
ncbi:hypothetical protein CKA32_004056 [Geitlerinema sp. FC II]|nr:hypothetical protein CKA32_004056 [Geitlerinema sp. FC II]